MASNQKEFKSKLKSLLKEYNMRIQFDCDASSDTHGLTGERIVIIDNTDQDEVLESWGWSMTERDI